MIRSAFGGAETKTERSGGQKGRGLGGKEFLPALAFPSPPNFMPTKLACRLKNHFSSLCLLASK
ncbi:hypothetical protein KKB43_03870 [Patescibacteria group bacterium]|nr:hypothetical protein [Patescibacteria group bacterium]